MKTVGELASPVCPECGGLLIWDLDSGEEVCGECGLVLTESTINKGPEWRAFTPEQTESRSRVGSALSFAIHDRGLSTMIRVGRDAYGRRIPLKTRFQMLRLRKWQIRSRVHSSVDRNLAQAMSELDRLTDKLHIPKPIKENAAVIYRNALEKGLVRGRRISSMVAASLYVACRATRTQRTLEEVARHSPVEKREISRGYRILLKDLGIRVPVPKAQYRVPRIASKVELGEETQRKAIEILREAERLKVTVGKDPMGLAAAALYIACAINGERRIQKVFAAAAGVTGVTVRNRYKGLKEALDLDRFKPSTRTRRRVN